MKNIGFGAYDGYRSFQGIEEATAPADSEWDDSKCGNVGNLCKDKVTQNDFDVILKEAMLAAACAECTAKKESRTKYGDICKTCSCLYRLEKIVTEGIKLQERLAYDGNEQARANVEAAVALAAEWVGRPGAWDKTNYTKFDWECIYNSFYGDCVGNQPYGCQKNSAGVYKDASCLPIRYGPAPGSRRGDGITSRLLSARDSVYFMSNITPTQNERRANHIRMRQDQLVPKIERYAASIGDEWDARGTFNAMNLGPLQGEWVEISGLIRDAWIYPETRAELLERQKSLLKKTEKVVIKAAREGKELGKKIDEANEALKDLQELGASVLAGAGEGLGLMRCLATRTKLRYKIGCFFKGNRMFITLAVCIAISFLVLWLLRPYVALLSIGK